MVPHELMNRRTSFGCYWIRTGQLCNVFRTAIVGCLIITVCVDMIDTNTKVLQRRYNNVHSKRLQWQQVPKWRSLLPVSIVKAFLRLFSQTMVSEHSCRSSTTEECSISTAIEPLMVWSSGSETEFRFSDVLEKFFTRQMPCQNTDHVLPRLWSLVFIVSPLWWSTKLCRPCQQLSNSVPQAQSGYQK